MRMPKRVSQLRVSFSPVRRINGALVAPHVVMRHPKSGRRVHLVGTAHMRTQDSWENINRKLALLAAQGNAIHVEGLRPVGPDATEDERYVQTLLEKNMGGEGSGILAELGLVPRRLGFIAPFESKNMDVSCTEISALLSEAHIDGLERRAERQKANKVALIETLNQVYSHPRAWRAITQLMTAITSVVSGSMERLIPGPTVLPREVIIDMRNSNAVREALKEEGDVVLFWGAAHVSGMMSLLKSQGYAMEKIEWSERLFGPKDLRIPSPASRNPDHETQIAT